MKNQKGFTLVEIAIVMVIIGLLLGGVLKGQEVITNARLKKIVNDFNGISAAVFSYQDRYRALPGDDREADTKFGTGVPNGNGTGIIDGNFDQRTGTTAETRRVWMHLRKSGLVAGSTDHTAEAAYEQPTHAYGGKVGIDNAIFGIRGHAVCYELLANDIALLVDTQNDDGVPNSGSVQAGTGNRGPTGANSDYTNTNGYNLCMRM